MWNLISHCDNSYYLVDSESDTKTVKRHLSIPSLALAVPRHTFQQPNSPSATLASFNVNLSLPSRTFSGGSIHVSFASPTKGILRLPSAPQENDCIWIHWAWWDKTSIIGTLLIGNLLLVIEFPTSFYFLPLKGIINGIKYAITTQHEPTLTSVDQSNFEGEVQKILASELRTLGFVDYYHEKWNQLVGIKTYAGQLSNTDQDYPIHMSHPLFCFT